MTRNWTQVYALQWDGTIQRMAEMRRAFGEDNVPGLTVQDGLMVRTIDGKETAQAGDWVVMSGGGNVKIYKDLTGFQQVEEK